ncbi:MAG: polysaccharide biosynthesis C-terminal domain-containing protein, partial [Polyangiaceae bacterium]
GLSRMRAYAVYTSLRYLLIALGLGLGLLLELPPEALPGIWSFSECVLFLALLVELFSTVSLRRAVGWQRWLREHIDYGVRGFAAVLLFEINSRLDIWMLGPRFSDSVVGVYSMAASMAEGASQLPVVLQVNVNPQLAAHLAAGRQAEVQTLIARTRRWFVPLMALLSVIAVALYPLLIPWLTGHPEFGDGSVPFALLMAGLVLSAPWLPYNQILLMGSRPGWHTVYVAVAVVANVLGCVLLIPRYGPLGAAASTAVSLLLSALLLRRLAAALLAIKL